MMLLLVFLIAPVACNLYYMEDLCQSSSVRTVGARVHDSELIYLNGSLQPNSSGILRLARNPRRPKNLFACEVHVRAPRDHYVLFYVSWMKIRTWPVGACLDKLEIYEEIEPEEDEAGSLIGHSTLNLVKSICGYRLHYSQHRAFTVKTPTALLRFIGLDKANLYNPNEGSDFELLFTAARVPSEEQCQPEEFACSRSKLCISGTLYCDGKNNCGNNSDESKCSVYDWMLVTAIFTLMVTLSITARFLFLPDY